MRATGSAFVAGTRAHEVLVLYALEVPASESQTLYVVSFLMAHADIVIITALQEEFDAARKVDLGAVDDWTEYQSPAGFDVALRTYQAVDGRPIRIALTWTTRMRSTASACAAANLIATLKPLCVAMCGVCAGRRGKVHPGDVIIGSLLYRYDAGARRVECDEQGRHHKRFQADPNPYPLDERWLRRAQVFKIPADAPWLAARPPTR